MYSACVPHDAATLRLFGASSSFVVGDLVRGDHLVLDLPYGFGIEAADGVALDDYLDPETRDNIDQLAEQSLASWRERFDPVLSHRGIALSEIWRTELLAEIFLPGTRAVVGTLRAASALKIRCIECVGVDPETVRMLQVASGNNLEILVASPGPLRSFPSDDAATPNLKAKPSLIHRSFVSAVEFFGLPVGPRAGVLTIPYGSTLHVIDALVTSHNGPRPMLYPNILPPRKYLLSMLLRGRWAATPNVLSRRRSKARLNAMLAEARGVELTEIEGSLPIGRELGSQALRMLNHVAGLTPATIDALDRSMRRRKVSAALLPFDQDPEGRIVAAVARRNRVGCLVVQHGYQPLGRYREGEFAGASAVWSDYETTRHATGDVYSRVTGNPRFKRPQSPTSTNPPKGSGLTAVVITQGYFRVSVALSRRITGQHIEATVRGLRTCGRFDSVIVRPHPSEQRSVYERILESIDTEQLAVEIDQETPLAELFARADVCIGSLSTATLETALVGLPVVMLDVTGRLWTAPLDGSGAIPYATTAQELATCLTELLDVGLSEQANRELLTALGATQSNPVNHIVGWIEEMLP